MAPRRATTDSVAKWSAMGSPIFVRPAKTLGNSPLRGPRGAARLASARGRGSAGRAQPCQGWGRGFESRRPLHRSRRGLVRRFRSPGLNGQPSFHKAALQPHKMATWPSGKAGACKALIPGSNPGVASKHLPAETQSQGRFGGLRFALRCARNVHRRLGVA